MLHTEKVYTHLVRICMLSLYQYDIYCIVGIFKEKNFPEFHESIVNHENFILKIFTKGIIEMALYVNMYLAQDC